MENINNQLLIDIDKVTDVNKLVQYFELISFKLDLKTISNYAKENNMSYNGVKKCKPHLKVDNVKFICDGITKNNLPF